MSRDISAAADTALQTIAPDVGCQYAPRCTACPWRVCVKELPAAEHNAFVTALRLLRGYLAAPDAGPYVK